MKTEVWIGILLPFLGTSLGGSDGICDERQDLRQCAANLNRLCSRGEAYD